jgi:hypothetical protein
MITILLSSSIGIPTLRFFQFGTVGQTRTGLSVPWKTEHQAAPSMRHSARVFDFDLSEGELEGIGVDA